MQLIFLFIIAVVWMVIKSMAQSQAQRQPQPAPAFPGERPVTRPGRSPEAGSELPKDILSGDTYFADKEATAVEVEELDAEAEGELSGLISRDNVLTGIIMSEVLGPPRAKRPHSLFGGR